MSARSTVPAWVIDGWYSNNPGLQALAIARFLTFRVASPDEIGRNAAFLAEPKAPTFGCSSCGRFAFAEPTVCFSCRRDHSQPSIRP